MVALTVEDEHKGGGDGGQAEGGTEEGEGPVQPTHVCAVDVVHVELEGEDEAAC